jgi:phage baseplate assembly protein W
MSIIKLPLNIDSSGKLAKVAKLDDIVKQKVLDYLSTSMFERPMMPTYGGNTNVLLYENFDPLIFEEYKLEALQGMQRNIAGAQLMDQTLYKMILQLKLLWNTKYQPLANDKQPLM